MGVRRLRADGDDGITLLDLQVVMGVMVILCAMTFAGVQSAMVSFRGDAAMAQVASAIRQARDAAIAQRRTVDLLFVTPNRIQAFRNELPDGQTLIADYGLESGVVFDVADRPDTPDGFGNAAAVDFGEAEVIRFQADGTLVDEDGIVLNGTIFLSRPSEPLTARAVTITGGSGRAQGYRRMGEAWQEVQ
jgi:Tfp pilus assembly protein FimT